MKQPPNVKTPLKIVLRRARVVFLLIIWLFILVSGAAVYTGFKTGEIGKKIVGPVKKAVANLADSLQEKEEPVKVASPSGDLFFEFEKQTPAPVKQGFPEQKKSTPAQKQPVRECYRYTVTHLDGSTSNLCYSRSDYNQLVNLGYALSSAKTFYQFHQEGAQKYQELYEQTGAKIYLDAKASSERDAQREKDKIGSIILQMQEIEKRGY